MYPTNWGSQLYPIGQGSQVYPIGWGSRVCPNGRGNRTRPGRGRRCAWASPLRLLANLINSIVWGEFAKKPFYVRRNPYVPAKFCWRVPENIVTDFTSISIMSPNSIAASAPTLHHQAIAGQARTFAMESDTRTAPNESRKQWEGSQTIWALHHTTKTPSLHTAIDRANIGIKPGGDGGSLFYGLIWEDNMWRRQVAGAHPPRSLSYLSSPSCLVAAAARTAEHWH